MKDLSGEKYGELTVVGFSHKIKYPGGSDGYFWDCACSCGNTKKIISLSLKNGSSKSCGCVQKEGAKKRLLKHGMRGDRFYHNWCNMKQRCFDERADAYLRYGARGITVCDKWLKFEGFKEDMYQTYLEHVSMHGERQTTIDRVDSNGNYSPENCRWATYKVQSNNRSYNHLITFQGETKNLKQWSEAIGINVGTLKSRIARAWSAERALTTPLRDTICQSQTA